MDTISSRLSALIEGGARIRTERFAAIEKLRELGFIKDGKLHRPPAQPRAVSTHTKKGLLLFSGRQSEDPRTVLKRLED